MGAAGLSSVGAVTGATRPDLLKRLRDLMPTAIFLLPGVGAQGGSVHDLGAAFATHPAGGLIASSRSIVGAHNETGSDPAQAAAAAARRLRGLPGRRRRTAVRPGRATATVALRTQPSACALGLRHLQGR